MQGDDGAVVDVAPGEVVAAGEVIELVTEVAVADVRGVEGEGEVEEELDDGEDGSEAEGAAQGRVGWTDGGRGQSWFE